MRHAVAGVAVGALLVSSLLAAETLKSGPQSGDPVSPFHPLNVTGQFAGEKQCLV
jgi:hypothetical protein